MSSLCWQRAKPVFIDETTCKAETALLGGAVGDSILMPDPLPSVTSSSVSLSTAVSGSRPSSRSGPSAEASSLTVGGTGSVSRTQSLPSGEETPQRSYLRPGGPLARLHTPRSSYNFKDDMEVFSPLVDVQPITPSLDKLWDGHEGAKKDHLPIDKKPSSMLFPSSSRRFPYAEDGSNEHSVFDWKSSSTSKQVCPAFSFEMLPAMCEYLFLSSGCKILISTFSTVLFWCSYFGECSKYTLLEDDNSCFLHRTGRLA